MYVCMLYGLYYVYVVERATLTVTGKHIREKTRLDGTTMRREETGIHKPNQPNKTDPESRISTLEHDASGRLPKLKQSPPGSWSTSKTSHVIDTLRFNSRRCDNNKLLQCYSSSVRAALF